MPQKMEQDKAQAPGEDQVPSVFPYNLIKIGKDLFERFKKNPLLTIPVGTAVIGAVYFLMLNFMISSCFVTLIPPFLMLAVFWTFGIKRAKMLLLAGAFGSTAILIASSAFFIPMYMEIEQTTAWSDDPAGYLRDAIVDPYKGDGTTVFNFTVDVYVNETNRANLTEVRVLIFDIGYSSMRNESMLAGAGNETYVQYYYASTVSSSINQFVVQANISGTWYLAADRAEGGEIGAMGPMYSDTWEVAKPLIYYSAIQAYIQFFVVYALLVGMIWWTRRARRMRQKQLENWETKRKEAAAQAPKDEAKVPSLAKAMGLEEDDSFVCSECGADVPADAKACPSCGEKFD